MYVILMQIGLEILTTEDQHLAMYFRLVEELLLGVAKSNCVLPYQLQNQNTLLWPVQLRKQYG